MSKPTQERVRWHSEETALGRVAMSRIGWLNLAVYWGEDRTWTVTVQGQRPGASYFRFENGYRSEAVAKRAATNLAQRQNAAAAVHAATVGARAR